MVGLLLKSLDSAVWADFSWTPLGKSQIARLAPHLPSRLNPSRLSSLQQCQVIGYSTAPLSDTARANPAPQTVVAKSRNKPPDSLSSEDLQSSIPSSRSSISPLYKRLKNDSFVPISKAAHSAAKSIKCALSDDESESQHSQSKKLRPSILRSKLGSKRRHSGDDSKDTLSGDGPSLPKKTRPNPSSTPLTTDRAHLRLVSRPSPSPPPAARKDSINTHRYSHVACQRGLHGHARQPRVNGYVFQCSYCRISSLIEVMYGSSKYVAQKFEQLEHETALIQRLLPGKGALVKLGDFWYPGLMQANSAHHPGDIIKIDEEYVRDECWKDQRSCRQMRSRIGLEKRSRIGTLMPPMLPALRRTRLLDLTGSNLLPSSRLRKDVNATLIPALRWLLLQKQRPITASVPYNGRIALDDWSHDRFHPIDVRLEAIAMLEDCMFSRSDAGIAGNCQWGLDGGHHQDGWSAYQDELHRPSWTDKFRAGSYSELVPGKNFVHLTTRGETPPQRPPIRAKSRPKPRPTRKRIKRSPEN
ncbi:hypothetical protein BDZ89DRAFT_1044208 [Hymenopellis radicata]|nr:hypothetical protein BDZ89DRAFT_1044208 [Hymenopellis radicata]